MVTPSLVSAPRYLESLHSVNSQCLFDAVRHTQIGSDFGALLSASEKPSHKRVSPRTPPIQRNMYHPFNVYCCSENLTNSTFFKCYVPFRKLIGSIYNLDTFNAQVFTAFKACITLVRLVCPREAIPYAYNKTSSTYRHSHGELKPASTLGFLCKSLTPPSSRPNKFRADHIRSPFDISHKPHTMYQGIIYHPRQQCTLRIYRRTKRATLNSSAPLQYELLQSSAMVELQHRQSLGAFSHLHIALDRTSSWRRILHLTLNPAGWGIILV